MEAELNWDSNVDQRGILVAVKGGVVTLGGHVPAYQDKWSAENAVKRIAGVRGIANDIEVKPEATAARSDSDIVTAELHALELNMSVPVDAVKVIVRDGWITLDGEVNYVYQRNAAENAVRNLWGVKGINNSILVKPQVSVDDIKGKIHQTFKRHADVDAERIRISVLDGTVTLTGEVHSWREREDAETAVSPGSRTICPCRCSGAGTPSAPAKKTERYNLNCRRMRRCAVESCLG